MSTWCFVSIWLFFDKWPSHELVFYICRVFLFWCNIFYRHFSKLVGVIENVTNLFGVIAFFDKRPGKRPCSTL